MKNENFARNIRALRLARGMTQTDLAERLGVTQTTVSGWEGGTVPRSTHALAELLEALGATDSDLFGYSDGFASRRGTVPRSAIAAADPKPASAPLVSESGGGRVPVPFEVMESHGAGYFVEVGGDCMSKVLPVGCLALIDPDQQPRSGSIALVKVDGRHMLRRWYRGAHSLLLSPDSYNPDHEDMIFTEQGEAVEVCGVCVWYQPREPLS